MGQITGGHVLYSRKTKPGDYEHEQADVLFNFTADEGDDAVALAGRAGDLARGQARRLLGFKDALQTTAAAAPAFLQPAASNDKAKLAAAVTGTAEEKPARTRAAKPPKVPEAVVAETPATPVAEAKDPAAMDEDLLGGAAPEITDAELVGKVTSTNARIKNPQAIKALTGSYVGGPPKTVRDIPQALRAEFIAKLEALKAA